MDELGVSAPDDYTFEVQLTRPVPYFEHAMVFTPFFPLNEKFVTEQGDNFALTVDGLLFSGPYKMTEWDVGGTRMVLEKNENYPQCRQHSNRCNQLPDYCRHAAGRNEL